ncbi:putative disease resistance rpp13-like protein 1 [Phtheirospermum japonicum]|uniref:Putative disease resistance rpp13-like protein 1 n=1 Tax=Phtheirospermum japonicum TaxID=374723 RepID=A0A830C5P4_9LAMI|nr:putative disease resistance rpp13-like protein 1 [Phtheirospermum japonicum]
MPVGELFLGAFLQVLFDKLGSGLILAFARRQRIYKLLKKWDQTLHMIHALIEDAEDKQLTDKSVKLWLEHLRDLAYDLDDVLDQISTQARIQNSKARQQNTCNFISICQDWTPEAFIFKKKMKSKIENISVRLDDISSNGNALKLSPNIAGPTTHPIVSRLPSTSVIEPYVCGRDKDKEEVCRIMIRNQESNNVCVIPIVGMGGIGKTTLAQLIYNDEMMSSGFDLKAWVCVSEVFDVFAITKTIFHSVTQASAESKDLNLLQESLQQTFSNKKFLLILDDVWNESYEKWDAFCRPFLVGLPGSKILVTTRNNGIAMMVGSVPSYHVNLLTNEDCLSLLAQHALGKRGFDKHPDLRRIGEALARKCRGLPLAAKTLGGLLRAKESPEEWEDVLYSKIWNLPRENNILPVLRLSYHHLPPHLKHLFAYCSIFPKDYEFDKYELVLLWMAEGFVPEPSDTGRKTKEQLGFEWFDELLSRSFFQRLSNNGSLFVMHDLINDLAQFVAGGICYKLDEKVETNDEYRVPDKARHASFLRHEYEVLKKFAGFYRVRGLRTFLPMPVQNVHVWPPFYLSNRILIELLPKLNSLRVLSLSGYSVTELPASICALIHLRYLNLSGTSIISLPDSLSELYNLETLSVRNCRFISKLPPAVGDLVNLRHLDNANTDQLKELPVDIKKLGNLQSLPKIVLSKDSVGLGLKELRNLELLRGSVSLLELQNVTDIEDAKEASLRRKQEIEELQLAWTNETDIPRDARLEEKVLDELQPHENLKKLKIEFYGGLRFPGWIGDPSFSKILSVSLSGCNKCTSLPQLGQLPELKHLRIGDMPRIKRIRADGPFPKLESLRFEHLPNWDEWFCLEHRIHFPSLRQLTIFKCPNVTSVSQLSLPVLNHLDLEECSMAVIKSLRDLDSLNYLKVESVAGLSHLPVELVQSITKTEVLECCNCNDLISVWPNGVTLQHLSRLRRLVVADCSQFVCMSEEGENDGQRQLPENLEILELFRCANLTSLPNGLKSLASLRELIIKNCPKIASFPENAIPRALRRLEILSCKALESLPNDVSNLERLEIRECPSLKNWSHGNFPNWLKKLSIKNCNKLDPVTENMFPANKRVSLNELSIWDWINFNSLLQHVHKFSRLSELYLSNCDRLENFPEQGLPPYLRTLSVEHCSNLRCLPTQIKNMRSIVSLEIRSCRRLRSFPRCDFPPNLTSLRIWDSRKLEPLSRWGLHRLVFLKEFSICGGFQDLELLSNDHCLFPPSLIKLSMARFPKLSSLSKVLENLGCLQHLSLMNCTSLNVLPSENVLEKLWHLEISDCPVLKQRCLKDKGDYWAKIAGIPCVEIDGTYIYRQC